MVEADKLAEIGKAIDKALKSGIGTFELIGYLEMIKVGMAYEAINEVEQHMSNNGVIITKCPDCKRKEAKKK